MDRGLTSGLLTETQATVSMPVIFIEIQTNGTTIRLWTGFGTITWNSVSWTGAGDLMALSPVTETTKIQAVGITGTLSGVDATLVTAVLSDLRRYKPAKMWVGALNSSLAVIADPYLVFNGRVDAAYMESDGVTGSITISAENRLITLNIVREGRYTDKFQRIKRPYDGGFKFVDANQDKQVQWNGVPAAAAPSTGAVQQQQNMAKNAMYKIAMLAQHNF